MRQFIKVQIGSITGSFADFLVTIICTESGLSWYLVSGIMGNCAGGFLQYTISRRWVFKNSNSGMPFQLLKYLFFFLGNILLSAAGIYALTELLHINYIVSKLLSSVLLGVSYNYYMQKHFVFS